MKYFIRLCLLIFIFSGSGVCFASDALNDFIHSQTADKHEAAGVDCESCHGEGEPTANNAPAMSVCMGCHGDYDELKDAEKVQKYNYNPHNGHFVDLECSTCHHGHTENEQFCSSCHEVSVK